MVIIGRQNVGKSSLLNTLGDDARAVVSPVPGTTRDTTETLIQWRGKRFRLQDSGGIEERPSSDLERAVTQTALAAARSADCIVFVVDGTIGATREDRIVARTLRTLPTPVLLVVNKIDSEKRRANVPDDVYRLGMPNVSLVSAKTGTGTGDLLDRIVALLPKTTSEEPETSIGCVLLGKPNVGKSSLLNALTHSSRSLVSPEAHTTRDPQESFVNVHGTRVRLIDTAGFRRGVKLTKNVASPLTEIEQESVGLSLRFLRHADVAALIVDASEPLTFQDRHLAEAILTARTGAFIVANKSDKTSDRAEILLRRSLPFLAWAPILFVSAKTGTGVKRILPLAIAIAQTRRLRIPDADLRNFLEDTMRKLRPAVSVGGRRPRIERLIQTRTGPPVFQLRIGGKHAPTQSYVRYIENALRKRFSLVGTPIALTAEVKKRI